MVKCVAPHLETYSKPKYETQDGARALSAPPSPRLSCAPVSVCLRPVRHACSIILRRRQFFWICSPIPKRKNCWWGILLILMIQNSKNETVETFLLNKKALNIIILNFVLALSLLNYSDDPNFIQPTINISLGDI